MEKERFKRAVIAGLFSIIIIGTLTFLSYETNYGLFLVASFGSSMVLVLGYPDSPFARGRNVFFGHLTTSIMGLICSIIFMEYFSFSAAITIPIAVGLGVFFMILLNVTHPPAGGNPIIVLLGGYSLDFIISPIFFGCLIIILQAYVINKYILKRNYKIWSIYLYLIHWLKDVIKYKTS